MNRCPALHETGNQYTRCYRDPNHDGAHLRYGDPTETVYSYVPVELVRDLIERHGGECFQ